MNRDWHRAHPMPPRATEAQRIAWHLEHADACACREIPPRLLARMRELGLAPAEDSGAAGSSGRGR
jgi:hypothetical protein